MGKQYIKGNASKIWQAMPENVSITWLLVIEYTVVRASVIPTDAMRLQKRCNLKKIQTSFTISAQVCRCKFSLNIS